MRTPRVGGGAGGGDRIMMEAQNLARLQAGQTPLAGGENPELHASDFSGVTPRQFAAATPNPLAGGLTPGATGRPGVTPALGGMTPGMGNGTTPSGRAIAGAKGFCVCRCSAVVWSHVLLQVAARAWRQARCPRWHESSFRLAALLRRSRRTPSGVTLWL